MGMAVWALAGSAAAALALAFLGEFRSDDPGLAEAPGTFEGRFLALSDADMTATAYADGKLEPFEGAEDRLVLFEAGRGVASLSAPNSVISWPQVVDVTPDGRHAVVVETRGAAPPGIAEMETVYADFPEGRRLTLFAITDGALSERAAIEVIGLNLQSVEVHGGAGDRNWLAIASEEDGAELRIATIDGAGRLTAQAAIDLAPPYRDDDAERRIRTLHVSPDGTTLAVNVANRRIQFYRLVMNRGGWPIAAEPVGAPVDVGVRLAVGRWTPDSRFFLVTDVNAYDSNLAMLTQRGGQVHVILPPDDTTQGRVVDSARVGRFAEGLEISDDGRRVASIAMERTYLPNWPVLAAWPKRRAYTLVLLALDPETGTLTELDRIRQAGVLPEDVIFDETGQNLAVAVFHRRKGPDRYRGFVDFFRITADDRLESQGVAQPVMRGVHDLVRIP